MITERQNKIKYIESSITGGHYAFQTTTAKKPFTNPMGACKDIKISQGDIIADIGAYVGEYSLYASQVGAKRIYAYEPTPQTFLLLEKNKTGIMKIYNKAVVGDNQESVQLFISSGVGVTNSIAKSYRKKSLITIPAVRYEDALQDANIVKIDVEGAEYLYNIVQPQLRAIILEFHPIRKKPWKLWAKKVMEKIEHAGFTPITRPEFKHGWDLIGSWQR